LLPSFGHPSSLLPLCSLSMKELNYSASPPVELPTDAASEQARVVVPRRKLDVAMQQQPRREYMSNKKFTQQLFIDMITMRHAVRVRWIHFFGWIFAIATETQNHRRELNAASNIDAAFWFFLLGLTQRGERVPSCTSCSPLGPFLCFCVSVASAQINRPSECRLR